MTYFLREKAQEEKRRGRGESSSSFLVSFLPSASDRRRSTLTADAYEADVKTFVKYEGTARGRSIRWHPRGWRGERSTRRDATREARFALLKARNRLCIKRGARNRRDSVTMDQPLLAPPGTPPRVILRSREIIIIWGERGRRVTSRSEDARRFSRHLRESIIIPKDAFTWFATRTIDCNSGDIFRRLRYSCMQIQFLGVNCRLKSYRHPVLY